MSVIPRLLITDFLVYRYVIKLADQPGVEPSNVAIIHHRTIKEDMKFASGHFAIFSSEVRENLHGHNYNVYVSYTTIIEDEGLSFDYRFYKDKLRDLCDSLNEVVLMPGKCKYLKIEEAGEYYHVFFNHEKIIFLKRDMKILPVTNITVEELSYYLLTQLLLDQEELITNKIQKIKIKVYSGPGQCGSATWRKGDV